MRRLLWGAAFWVVLVTVFANTTSAMPQDTVVFGSTRLEGAVARALNVFPPVYAKDILRLKTLYLAEGSIGDIKGLDAAKNLQVLRMYGCRVRDLSPLAKLTSLRELLIEDAVSQTDGLKDLKPLAGLSELRHLTLRRNLITDITPIAGLTNLVYVDVSGNQIGDFEPLRRLPKLLGSRIDGNPGAPKGAAPAPGPAQDGAKTEGSAPQQRALSPADYLVDETTTAFFCLNARFETLPLSGAIAFPEGAEWFTGALENLPREPDKSARSDLAALVCEYARRTRSAKGTVEAFDAKHGLVQVLLDGRHSPADIAPSTPTKIPVQELARWIATNRSDFVPCVRLDEALDRYRQTERGESAPTEARDGVNSNGPLAKSIADELGCSLPVSPDDLVRLVALYLTAPDLKSLDGLEGAKNLRVLRVYGCPIESLAPIKGLENLQELLVEGTAVRDLAPLAGLSKLRYLSVPDNKIDSIEPLGTLDQLVWLDVSGNGIQSFRVLQKLPGITQLTATGNPAPDTPATTAVPPSSLVDFEPHSGKMVPAERLAARATVALFCLHSRHIDYAGIAYPQIEVPDAILDQMLRLREDGDLMALADVATLQLEYIYRFHREYLDSRLAGMTREPLLRMLFKGKVRDLKRGDEDILEFIGEWLCDHRGEFGPSARLDTVVQRLRTTPAATLPPVH